MGKDSSAPPRVRLAKSIDLGMADPNCEGCDGGGIVGYRTADLGDGEGEQELPVICKCVSRNGGVAPDELDRILAEAAQQIADGVFHEAMANDMKGMPYEVMTLVVASYARDLVNMEKSSETREAVDLVFELIKTWDNWEDIRADVLRILMKDANDQTLDDEQRNLAADAMILVRNAMN